MIGECRIIRCFHGRYAADHRAGCIVEGDAGGNGGIVVTQADSNLCGAAVDVGGNEIVLDALFRAVQQVDITENAVHAEHILIFHVTAIAPFQHEDRQMVGAVLQKLRYIELACGMGDLTVPDKLTVEPDVEAGGNALKIQKCARGSGILLVGEVVEVSAAGILFGNIRRISGERIADVGVLVVVVAVVLPHAGDRDAVKSGGIIADLIESILQVINTGVVPKFPASVQKLEAIRGLAVLD